MPIVLFFSSRQISAHPIRNFRSNQSTPGRFDNIGYGTGMFTIIWYGKGKKLKVTCSFFLKPIAFFYFLFLFMLTYFTSPIIARLEVSRESDLCSVPYNRPVCGEIVREKREINITLEPYKITWRNFIRLLSLSKCVSWARMKTLAILDFSYLPFNLIDHGQITEN